MYDTCTAVLHVGNSQQLKTNELCPYGTLCLIQSVEDNHVNLADGNITVRA